MTSPVVLITGALAGIGRATALAFAREGARLVVSGRNADAGAALVAELSALGVDAEFVRADVRHEADVRSAGRPRRGPLRPARRRRQQRRHRRPARARWSTRPPKATPPPSTPTCWARC